MMQKLDDVVNVFTPSSESNRFTLMGSKNWHHVKHSSANLCYAQGISQIQRNNITNLRIKHTEVTTTYTPLIKSSISPAEKFLELKGRFSLSIYLSIICGNDVHGHILNFNNSCIFLNPSAMECD